MITCINTQTSEQKERILPKIKIGLAEPPTVIIVNGYPRSGKDSFIRFCNDCLNECGFATGSCSSIDIVKKIAIQLFDWDGKKTPKSRKFLSDLKDILTRAGDIPLRYIIHQFIKFYKIKNIGNLDEKFFFVQMREPKEIEKTVNYFTREGIKVITVFVNRGYEKNKKYSNHADAEVENYFYNFYIENQSSLEDLERLAWQFCREVLVP